MPTRNLTPHELELLSQMIHEFEFARDRKLLATQRWRSLRVWSIYVIGATLYLMQLGVGIWALVYH